MTDYNYSPDNMVEIDLAFDCFCYVPCKGSDGELDFKEAHPLGDKFSIVEGVKVPKEATASREALQEFLETMNRNNMRDSLYLDNANIFDESVGEHGAFRFK